MWTVCLADNSHENNKPNLHWGHSQHKVDSVQGTILGSNFLLPTVLPGSKLNFQVANLLLATVNFEPWKWGLRGSKLYRHVFVMHRVFLTISSLNHRQTTVIYFFRNTKDDKVKIDLSHMYPLSILTPSQNVLKLETLHNTACWVKISADSILKYFFS